MPWHVVRLSVDDVELGVLKRMVDLYSEMRLSAGEPKGAPIYSRQAADGSVAVFFTPAASRIAGRYMNYCGAEVCEQPTGVSLLVGDQDDVIEI